MSAPVIEVREEVERFLAAVHALLPSSNYLSQYLFTMPKDYPTMYDFFPEFLADPVLRDRMGKVFGVEYASNISLRYDLLGAHYATFMGQIFRFLEIQELRAALCDLLGISDSVLLHPRKEWMRAIIEGFKADKEKGPVILQTLKILSETREPFTYWRGKEDLRAIRQEGKAEGDL